jgi:glucokinase
MKSRENIALVADIGGTRARFALVESGGEPSAAAAFSAAEFASVEAAARAFLASSGAKPRAACFAVAAPIGDGAIRFINSPFRIEREALKAALGLDRLVIVNDFAALAASVPALKPRDFFEVKPGRADQDAPTLVLGPGTGFGQSLIVPCGARPKIIATEGGHVGFSPRGDEETAAHRRLAERFGRVSIERLLSGPGLVNIYRALGGGGDLGAEEMAPAARNGNNTARETLALFFAVLGAAAGDAALATGARDVVLGGGILPRLKEGLMASAFVERFLDKGRMRSVVEPIRIRLIMRDGAALVGAAMLLNEARR